MRKSADVVDLVRKVHDGGGIVAAICHAGWVLASAGIAKGKQLTCVPVIRDDVLAAGAEYVDRPVVRDGNLITSRLPNDAPVFCAEIIKALGELAEHRGTGSSWPAAGPGLLPPTMCRLVWFKHLQVAPPPITPPRPRWSARRSTACPPQ